MKNRFLEVTYRRGAPIAAYLYLSRQDGDFSARTEPIANGMLVDYSSDGRPIGVEITAPRKASLAELNQALAKAGQDPVTDDDIAPLLVGGTRAASPG